MEQTAYQLIFANIFFKKALYDSINNGKYSMLIGANYHTPYMLSLICVDDSGKRLGNALP